MKIIKEKRTMKKTISFLLVVIMCLSLAPIMAFAKDVPAGKTPESQPNNPVYGSSVQVTILLNGKTVIFDQAPIIRNGRTLVPMRAVFEAMGAKVEWDVNTQTITATRGTRKVIAQIGSTTLTKANLAGGFSWQSKSFTIDVAPQIVNNRTLVPLRAVAESFDAQVQWDGATQTVTITDANATK